MDTHTDINPHIHTYMHSFSYTHRHTHTHTNRHTHTHTFPIFMSSHQFLCLSFGDWRMKNLIQSGVSLFLDTHTERKRECREIHIVQVHKCMYNVQYTMYMYMWIQCSTVCACSCTLYIHVSGTQVHVHVHVHVFEASTLLWYTYGIEEFLKIAKFNFYFLNE